MSGGPVDFPDRYEGAGHPRAGDVVDSDGTELLVLAVEPIPKSWDLGTGGATVWLRGVSRKFRTAPAYVDRSCVGSGWLPDENPEHRASWLPWRCKLVRRDALGELTGARSAEAKRAAQRRR